jgi:mannose-6-phosphate isomerase-like protein (cupin superfamily)
MAEPAKRFILNAEQRVYVERDWGSEDWIWNGRYCGKKLVIRKGKTSDWIYHRVKDKVLYVESGRVLLTYGWDEDVSLGATLTLTADMAFHIPPGMYHKIQGLEESRALELSTHHSEKDVLTPGMDAEPDNDADRDTDS